MKYMFYECTKLNKILNIIEWDTKIVENMSFMFRGCESLNNLPDISKWDTKNVTNMSNMFLRCDNIIVPKKFRKKSFF